MAGYVLDLYLRGFEKRNRRICPRRLEEEFAGLYPGRNARKQVIEYYRKKTENAIKIGMACILIVALFIGKQIFSRELTNGRYLERSPMGGTDKSYAVEAVIGNTHIEDIVVNLGKRELSEKAKRELLSEVDEKLEEAIMGQNKSLEHVNHPLNLLTGWEGTEVCIDWTSGNYGVLTAEGAFGTEYIPKEGMEVELTAEISLGEIICEKRITVRVFPEEKTEEELQKESLTNLIETKERESRSMEYLELPANLEGQDIVWELKRDKSQFGVLMLPIVAVLAVIWGMDKDIHKRYLERNRQLLLEYSEFVSKLQLLIGAGMSIRNAFVKLAEDYKKRRAAGGNKKYVYEEVIMMVRKLENGVGEEEAYDYFAKRCNLGCYRKLMSIIIQSRKKGAEGLKDSLSAEVRSAFEERKQEAARLGEEAGTKLLLPMMMMMGVVLMIIVIPAYFSFGGI